MSGYGEDLAYIHHSGFMALAERATPQVIELLRRAGIGSGLVVELGCGSGLTARGLVDEGYEVLGIDASPAMIELARHNAPGAELRVGSFVSEPLPPCAAVIAIGEVLGYLLDPRAGMAEIERLFARVHAALAPGGLFVFDLAGPGRAPGPGPTRNHALGSDWAVLHEASEDPEGRLLRRRITTFRHEPEGDGYRRSEERHELVLLPAQEALAKLRACGFTARSLRGYGGKRMAPGHSVFVARRR
ncbi:MAG TPA: methyltransferase domain-containing protein [Thermoleophilaceae bacterium]|nr:methyltransferase domain-containing protein [Thermoleophilaceae bacterium]